MNFSPFTYLLLLLLFLACLFSGGCAVDTDALLRQRQEYVRVEAEAAALGEQKADSAAASIKVAREMLLPSHPQQAKEMLLYAENALPKPSSSAVWEWQGIAYDMVRGNNEKLDKAAKRLIAQDNEIAALRAKAETLRKEYEKGLESKVNEATMASARALEDNRQEIRKMLARTCLLLGGAFIVIGFLVGAFGKHYRIASISSAFGICVISLGFFGAMLPLWAVVTIGLSIFLPVPFLMVWTYNRGIRDEETVWVKEQEEIGKKMAEEIALKVIEGAAT